MSEVIPYRRWVHAASGRSASIRGAVPYANNAEAEGWAIEDAGFTVLHPDGTTGTGVVPFTTREAAQAWCDAHPNFRGMSRMGD
jgi:hypothetical protein